MESILIIAGNNKNCSEKEREELIARAVEIYMRKRRKAKIFEATQKVEILSRENNDDDPMCSKDIFAVDADGEDFEDDSCDDSSDSYDDDFDPFD